MDCKDIRDRLLAHRRGQLDPVEHERVEEHLQGCAGCRGSAELDAQLSDVLARRLPAHPAPAALKRLLAERVAGSAPAVPGPRRRARNLGPVASALAAAAIVLVAIRLVQPGFLRPRGPTAADLVDEGVNDHLRVVASANPIEIEGGGIHQVKPWFTGRLDFAPRVSFSGDADFQLAGGSVGYFRDRKAAVFVFRHRLHTISLFVFRGEGLPWPSIGLQQVGPLQVAAEVSRGFSVLLWREGELGYCLVSDVNRGDLEKLAVKIASE
jgi:anti-sigma factor RsiW